MNKEIVKGTIVHYKDGWMQVSAKFADSVNLCHIFHSKPVFKKVPLDEVFADHDNWYKNWEQSETYKCM